MKPGEVYRHKDFHGALHDFVYVVIEDYGTLRPLIIWQGILKRPKPYINTAIAFCPSVFEGENKSGFYDSDEKIADSLEDFIVSNVIERELLSDD